MPCSDQREYVKKFGDSAKGNKVDAPQFAYPISDRLGRRACPRERPSLLQTIGAFVGMPLSAAVKF